MKRVHHRRHPCQGLSLNQFFALLMAGWLLIGIMPVDGADVAVARPASDSRSCDAVCQLRAQDWAFSLLVETYREFRSNQIENNYRRRLQVVAGFGQMPDDTTVIQAQLDFLRQLREILGELAQTERTRGLQLVHTQVANLNTVYDCARKHDEQALGFRVDKSVNLRRQAAQELKQYIAVRSDLLSGRSSAPQAASAVLLDRPALPADPALLAETCD